MPSTVHVTSVSTAEGRSFTNPTFMKDTEVRSIIEIHIINKNDPKIPVAV